MSDNAVVSYGFTALPANQSLIKPVTEHPAVVSVETIHLPSTALAKRIDAYAKAHLSPQTYNHSLRVFTYGVAIARECFPDFGVTPGSNLEETWFLTAMLHDIGTCDEFIDKTQLSFEFWGAFHALKILTNPREAAHGNDELGNDFEARSSTAPRAQAESVAEAIIRHQDVQDKGNITLVTRLIHLGTLLDNIGAGQQFVHPDTIRLVNEKFDRRGWSSCFKNTVVQEKTLKPWAMVSRIEGFEDAIEENGKTLMKTWD